MRIRCLLFLSCLTISCLPVLAQEKLYPVRGDKKFPAILTSDGSAFVVEKSFSHKLTLGFPTDDHTALLPDTKAPLVMLWLRVQNVSQRPLQVDVAKFTAMDDGGKMVSALAPEEASRRMIEAASGGSIGAKTLRGISLGSTGN